MNEKKLIWTGGIGSAIAAICCFTPALVLALGAVGLSAGFAWTDRVLLPALVTFLAIVVYGLHRCRRVVQATCAMADTKEKAR
jgi:mercuric ion transport protein